jgi:hypothetical protein
MPQQWWQGQQGQQQQGQQHGGAGLYNNTNSQPQQPPTTGYGGYGAPQQPQQQQAPVQQPQQQPQQQVQQQPQQGPISPFVNAPRISGSEIYSPGGEEIAHQFTTRPASVWGSQGTQTAPQQTRGHGGGTPQNQAWTLAQSIGQYSTNPQYQNMLTPNSSWHQGDWQLQQQLQRQKMQEQAQLQRSLFGQVHDVYGGDAGAMRDAYTEQFGGSQHFSVIDEMLQALMSNPHQLGGGA